VSLEYIETLFYLTFGLFLFILGFVIFRENPRERINRVTGLMIFFAGLGTFLGSFGFLFQSLPEATRAELDFLRRGFLIWEFFFPFMIYFSLIFPRESTFLKRFPKVIYFIFLPYIFHFLIVLIFSSADEIRNLITISGFEGNISLFFLPVYYFIKLVLFLLSLVYEFHERSFAVINFLYIVIAITLMYLGYRSLRKSKFKQQVSLILWGIRSSVGLYAIAFLLPIFTPLRFEEILKFLFVAIALVTGSGTIAWSIIKYRFLDVRLILRKGIIYSLASSLLVGIYIIIYGQVKNFIEESLLIDIPILEIIFIILAMGFFQPILNLFERGVEKIFARNKLNYQNIMSSLSKEIMAVLDIGTLVNKIKETLKESMLVENVNFILEDSSGNYRLLSFNNEESQGNNLIDRNGELIQFLSTVDDPIMFDEVAAKVHDEKAIKILKKTHPYLLLPLAHRGKLTGVMSLGSKMYSSRYSYEDAAMLEVLSSQIAIALENSKLYEERIEKEKMEEELSLAKDIQLSLLPAQLPTGDEFKVAAISIPCKEVGGDYFDFFRFSQESLGIAIGDVAGKGVPAALLMANIQASLRTLVEVYKNDITNDKTGINEILNKVNHQLRKSTSPDKFITFFYGIINFKTKELHYSNAGHNYPIIVKGNGKSYNLKAKSFALGIVDEPDYKEFSKKLEKGDTLVFYTDGITEAFGPFDIEFGEERLIKLIKENLNQNPEEITKIVYDNVLNYSKGYYPMDDVTLVIIRIE